MVIDHTPASERGTAAENEGRYTTASNLYLKSAAGRVNAHFDEPESDPSDLNLAFADLLRAMYCARRAGESERAEGLGTICNGLAQTVQLAPHSERWAAMLTEILGDSRLLLESEGAAEYYTRAAAEYRDFSLTERISDGLEPEHLHVQWVIEDFLEWRGVDAPAQSTEAFQERIDSKIEILRILTAE